MTEFEVTCKVEKGERNIAYGEDCYCYYAQPNYNERIVRCRDCKHCKPLSNFHKHLGCYNDFLNKHEAIPVCDDGFCAWGEERQCKAN